MCVVCWETFQNYLGCKELYIRSWVSSWVFTGHQVFTQIFTQVFTQISAVMFTSMFTFGVRSGVRLESDQGVHLGVQYVLPNNHPRPSYHISQKPAHNYSLFTIAVLKSSNLLISLIFLENKIRRICLRLPLRCLLASCRLCYLLSILFRGPPP